MIDWEEEFKAKGYSGIPAVFRIEFENGNRYDRSTGFNDAFLEVVEVEQVWAILDVIINTAIPADIKRVGKTVTRAWVEDAGGNVIKELH